MNNDNKVIVWGSALIHPVTLKKADIHITNIFVDNHLDVVSITREIGLDVKVITIPIEEAMDICFINLEVLRNYL